MTAATLSAAGATSALTCSRESCCPYDAWRGSLILSNNDSSSAVCCCFTAKTSSRLVERGAAPTRFHPTIDVGSSGADAPETSISIPIRPSPEADASVLVKKRLSI